MKTFAPVSRKQLPPAIGTHVLYTDALGRDHAALVMVVEVADRSQNATDGTELAVSYVQVGNVTKLVRATNVRHASRANDRTRCWRRVGEALTGWADPQP